MYSKIFMTKSFLFSLMVISVLKNSDFYRKVQGRVQAGMMLSVARAIGVKRGISRSLQWCVQAILLKPWQRENTHRCVDLVIGLRHTGSQKWTLFLADLGWHFVCLLALVFSYISRYEDLLWRDFGFMGGSFSCFRRWEAGVLPKRGRMLIGLCWILGVLSGSWAWSSGRGRTPIGGRDLSSVSCFSIFSACLNPTSLTMEWISSWALVYPAASSSSWWS